MNASVILAKEWFTNARRELRDALEADRRDDAGLILDTADQIASETIAAIPDDTLNRLRERLRW